MQYAMHAEIIFEYRSSNASGPAQQREEFRIGFFASYDRIWELIALRNDLQHYQDGFHVLGVPTFNERVARETLLNAASHRSYRSNSSIFVRQYRDRLVVDSPGGFPSGITIDNILEKQSPRNHLIANIFALCGLVERAGQGMNLIYELCIKEAKALPDFKGTDPYYVCVTLNGLITDEKLLLMFKKIDSEIVDTFTTEDYLVINSLFHTQNFSGDLRPHVKRLVELGIVEHHGHGRYLLARNLYEAVGEMSTHIRLSGLDRVTKKELIMKHIRQCGNNGTPPRDLQNILPGCSRRQIQLLLNELRNDGSIYTEGQTTAVRWFAIHDKG
jgi:ATP-dependent DNA helicase RecG